MAYFRTSVDPHSDVGATRPRTRPLLAETPTADLEAELTALARRLHARTCDLLAIIGELDARGTWAIRGALSCAAWLAEVCDIDISTARTHVRVATAMRTFPDLAAAMSSGAISYAKARTLAAHLDEHNVDALLSIAHATPANDLGAAIAAWSLRNEDQDVIDRRQHDERRLSWRVEPDGMVTFTLKLPPAEAARLQACIDTEVMRGLHPRPEPPDASADASEPARPEQTTPTPAPSPTPPPIATQRADAMCRIVGRIGAGDTTDGAAPKPTTTEIVVHVRADGNTLADGTPLSDNIVGAMLPEAFVSLLIHDNARKPVDASPRRRYPTRRQRRVVDERCPECAHPGCHARLFLQYDHIDPHHLGGPTIVDNLQRLCGPHNRAKNPPPQPSSDTT